MEINRIQTLRFPSTAGFFCSVLLIVFTATAIETGDTTGTVNIYGYRDGETCKWAIGKDHRTSKATLIFCSTPNTKKDVRLVSDKLGVDSANHSHVQLCYVIKNKGTLVPGMLLKNMMLKISRKNPQNIYCLEKDDEYTILWGKIERSARMSIIDNSGLVLFAEYLPMQEDDFLRVYKIIKSLQ